MDDASRPIHPLFMLGLIAVPAVFVWFLLLPGYAASTRLAAFVYAFGPAVVLLAASFVIGGFALAIGAGHSVG